MSRWNLLLVSFLILDFSLQSNSRSLSSDDTFGMQLKEQSNLSQFQKLPPTIQDPLKIEPELNPISTDDLRRLIVSNNDATNDALNEGLFNFDRQFYESSTVILLNLFLFLFYQYLLCNDGSLASDKVALSSACYLQGAEDVNWYGTVYGVSHLVANVINLFYSAAASLGAEPFTKLTMRPSIIGALLLEFLMICFFFVSSGLGYEMISTSDMFFTMYLQISSMVIPSAIIIFLTKLFH